MSQTVLSPIFKASLCWKLYVPFTAIIFPVVETVLLVNLRFLLGLYISWIMLICLFSYTIKLILISTSMLIEVSSVPLGFTKILLISKEGEQILSFLILFTSINPIIGKVFLIIFILLSVDRYKIFKSKFAFSNTLLMLILDSILLIFVLTERISWILLSQFIFSLIFAFVFPIPTIVLISIFFSNFCKSSILTSLIFSMLEFLKIWILKFNSALILTFLSLIILQLICFKETSQISFISLFASSIPIICEKSILWLILFTDFFFPSLPTYIT